MPAGKIFVAARAGRRRRVARRPRRKMMITRQIRSKLPTLKVQRTFWLQAWAPSTASVPGYWQYWTTSPSQLPNASEYTALFDKYKVTSIKFTFRPRYDNFAGSDTTDTTLPGTTAQGGTNMHVIIDPTSNVVPSGAYSSSTLNAFLENGRVRSYTGNKPISVFIKYPCVAEDSNGTSNARYQKAQWYSTNLMGVQHRGFHAFLQDTNLTGVFNQTFDVFVTYNILFKGMK